MGRLVRGVCYVDVSATLHEALSATVHVGRSRDAKYWDDRADTIE